MPTNRRSEAIWIESKGYWQIKVQKDGVRKAFTSSLKGRKGKHEAEAKADYWLERGTTEMRFCEAWGAFLDAAQRDTGTGNFKNLESYGRVHLAPTLANKKLSAITRNDWQSCISAMADKGLSERTCKNVISSISAFLSFCQGESWEVKPLTKPLAVPATANPTKERKILQPPALKILFSDPNMPFGYGKPLVPAFYIHAWRFYVVTGLRRGELAGLRNEDITSVINVRRNINNLCEETHGKNENARRTMVLSSIAAAILKHQREMLQDMGIESDWVFPDKYGERSDPRRIYKNWVTYREYHNIECTIHELRHTFVSINKLSMPLELLKNLVGHSVSMDTIGVYGHEIDGEKELAAQYVDDAFAKLLK